MWTVTLIEKPKQDDFPRNFFPRTVRYKDQAETLKREVEFKGGIAKVEKKDA